MIVTVLVENTTSNKELLPKHALSLHIRTKNHNILFDLGKDKLFMENAEKLGIDLTKVDIAVISHGHCDHGKGLENFLEINSKAPVYLSRYAFGEYFAREKNGQYVEIGLDKKLKASDRLVFLDKELAIDDELAIYGGIEQSEYISAVNKSLYKKTEKGLVSDDFLHELNLVVRENEKAALFTGCSHNGIVNILSQIQKRTGLDFDHVLGGFHTYVKNSLYTVEDEYLKKLGERLLQFKAHFYTFHCTGIKEYKKIKKVMEDKIDYLATGSIIES